MSTFIDAPWESPSSLGPRIQASLLSHRAAADFIEQYLLFVLTLRA
jgi:hypothetical protein